MFIYYIPAYRQRTYRWWWCSAIPNVNIDKAWRYGIDITHGQSAYEEGEEKCLFGGIDYHAFDMLSENSNS
jgi:hypothetical protein